MGNYEYLKQRMLEVEAMASDKAPVRPEYTRQEFHLIAALAKVRHDAEIIKNLTAAHRRQHGSQHATNISNIEKRAQQIVDTANTAGL